MRKENGQFMSNKELVEILQQKIKTNHQQALSTIDSYKAEYNKIYQKFEDTVKERNKFKNQLDIFSCILRLTEIFLIPLIGIPFIALFIVGDLESAVNALVTCSKVYCFSCFAVAIMIIHEHYEE